MNNLLRKKTNELTKKKKKGFTLVELIIVIAIIAILAAIAIPKFGAIRKNSNVAADQANAKIIATAVASAVADGKASPATESVYKTYIDGGNVPAVKSVSSGTWTVSYDDTNGVRVLVGSSVMYPPVS